MQLGKFSFFRSGIKNKSTRDDIPLSRAIHLMRSDKNKESIGRLRSATDKSVRTVLKSSLDYFTFSGTFKERKVEGLEEHSGIMCIDFDLNGEYNHKDLARQLKITIPEAKELYPEGVTLSEYNIENIKYQISLNPFTLVVFTSPSGTGLKVLVKIDRSAHLGSFEFLEKYYLETFGLFVDTSGKDVSRACFASWDPALFYNPESDQCPVGAEASPLTPHSKEKEQEYRINEDTGEVIPIGDADTWDRKKKEEFDRAVIVAGRIFERKEDITSQYDDWLMIGMSMATFGESGRALYHKVSQFNPEYSEKDCDAKFNNLVKGSKFTNPAKFFKIAKEYGIDVKVGRTIAPGLAEGADSRAYQEWQFTLPDGVTLSDELKKHVFRYNFIEHDCRYHYATYSQERREVCFTEISNFIIRPLFLIMSKADPKRIIEIENIFGAKKVLDIPTKAFVSLNDFNVFVESQGNFLFEGDKNKFNKIKSKLYDLTQNAEEVRTLGWHKDRFYSFANGIYNSRFEATDDYGVVQFKEKNYFIPALSSIYKDEEEDFESQKKFLYVKHKITFKDWATDFCKVHKDNGKIGLAFYLTSLFRDIVYQRFKFFPHLFLFGPPGTGKSQLGWSISYMFGEAQLPFNLNGGTKVAFHKKFAVYRNAVIWFDEYNNAIDYGRVQALKAAYDGTGHEKSEMTSANRTKTTPVNSSCIISGQELPIADNALFKRTILLQYYQTEFSDEEAKAHSAFRLMEQKALSHITGHLTTLRAIVEEHYFKNFEDTLKEFKEIMTQENNIEERIIQNMVILVAMFKTLENHLEMPFSYEQLKEMAVSNIKNQNNLISNAKETSTFWDLVEFMIDKKDIVQNVDFKIQVVSELKVQVGRMEDKVISFNDGKEKISKQVLYLRLAKIHPLYLEAHRRQYNKNGLDKGSLIHYLSNTKGFLGNIPSTRFDNSNSSAFAFDYDYLESQGINLYRGEPDIQNVAGQPAAAGAPTLSAQRVIGGEDDDLPF